jgi:RNA polymerase sigma-70 factor (ECF subfamily)
MTWRFARIDPETLAPQADACFVPVPVAPPASEASLLGLLRQRLCSDEELADQLQSGNADALAVLFKRHSPVLFGIARRVLRNDAEAEDAVQQIFLDVYRSIQQFDREIGSFKSWLLMFAYHRTFNSRRSQIANRFFDTGPIEDEFTAENSPASWAKDGSLAENRILVEQVLKSLQPRQRRTIELVYYEGLTAEEVATRTGESVRVVRHNLYRGLNQLRKAFCGPQRPGSHGKGRS